MACIRCGSKEFEEFVFVLGGKCSLKDFLKGVAWEDSLREITPGMSWRRDGELGRKVRKAKVNLNSDREALLE